MDLSIYLWYYSAAGIYFSFRWGPFVHSLEIVLWDSTRRDHPRYPGRVSGSGLFSARLISRPVGCTNSRSCNYILIYIIFSYIHNNDNFNQIDIKVAWIFVGVIGAIHQRVGCPST